jgi:hypothetical protein
MKYRMMDSQEGIINMEHMMIISIVSVAGMLGGGVGFEWMRREIIRKRNESRMSQALRRGLANPDGVRTRATVAVLQWQSCESSAQ